MAKGASGQRRMVGSGRSRDAQPEQMMSLLDVDVTLPDDRNHRRLGDDVIVRAASTDLWSIQCASSNANSSDGGHAGPTTPDVEEYLAVMDGRQLRVRLLGGFAVEIDGRRVPDDQWRHRRAASLVKLLALAPGHRLVRDAAIDALWPTLDVSAAASNLRKAAHHARRTIGVTDAVVLDGVTVHLMPQAKVLTDVAAFESTAHEAIAKGELEACREAAARHTGELLPEDRYEPWSQRPRQRVESLYRQLLVAARLWGRLLEVEPTSELAHREIIRERLEAGDRAGAIREFDRLRTVLREELGVSPDPESVALYERVLAFEGRDVPTPAERARALLAWGTVHWERDDLHEAERTAIEARALAVDAGLGRELADANELLALVAYAQGRWREVFAREFLDTVDRTPELAGFVYDANLCMSEFVLHEVDGVSSIAAFAGELLARADRDRSGQVRALGLLLRGEAGLFGDGDLATVSADLRESVRRHEERSSGTGLTLATERLAQTEMARGRSESAMRLHQRALSLTRHSAVPAHLLPLVYGGMLSTVGPRAGAAILEDADIELAGHRVCDPCSMSYHLGAAAVRAHAGRYDRARDHLEEARRIAGMWQQGPWTAGVAEARAALRRAEGADASEVTPLLRAAVDGFLAANRHRDADRCRAYLVRS